MAKQKKVKLLPFDKVIDKNYEVVFDALSTWAWSRMQDGKAAQAKATASLEEAFWNLQRYVMLQNIQIDMESKKGK